MKHQEIRLSESIEAAFEGEEMPEGVTLRVNPWATAEFRVKLSSVGQAKKVFEALKSVLDAADMRV